MQSNLKRDLDVFMGDLCVGWGFCNYTLHGRNLIAEGGGTVDAEAFAKAILHAEGMTPEYEPGWMRALKHAFIERYGNHEVSVEGFEAN